MQPRPESEEEIISKSEAPILIISRDGRIRFCNAAAEALYCLPLGAALPHPVPGTEQDEFAFEQKRLSLCRKPVEWMGEAAWLLTVTGITPLSTTSDRARITELTAENRHLHRENQRLLRLSHADPLTGLLNRRGLVERLGAEQARLHRGGEVLSAILIDLDDFKALNDAMGYDVGDRTLIAVSKTMRQALRTCDILARIGGDEFLILLPGTGPEPTMLVADRIRQSIEDLDGGLTVSMGVMGLSTKTLDLARILEQIHGALSTSKTHGKNRVTQVSPETAPSHGPRFSGLWAIDGSGQIAERCQMPPSGGLHSTLLMLDACTRRIGTVPLHIPLSPKLLLQQPGLLQVQPTTRRWVVSLPTASLTDEVLSLRPVVARLRARGVRLSLIGFTGSRRGLEAMVLLRPTFITLHPRQLSSRTPGALECLCATATALGIHLLADNIDDAQTLQRARAVGIIGGTGQALGESRS